MKQSQVWWGEPQSNIQMGQYDSRFEALRSHRFDPAALWDRVGGDVELLRDLVTIFCDQYPTLLEKLKEAIEQPSFSEVQKYSHKLRGSALQFSGSVVAELAGLLEQMAQKQSLDGAAGIFSKLQPEVAELAHSLRAMVYGKA